MAFEPAEPAPVIKPCDERTAESLFRKLVRRFENVRNVSSPVLKLITVHRLIDEFMAAFHGTANSVHEADNLIIVIFYILTMLQTPEAKYLGARFIEECMYIDSFMHEDQIDLIEEYANIEHMKMVLESFEKGLKKCEKLFITPGSECSSGSRSSQSESTMANALEDTDDR